MPMRVQYVEGHAAVIARLSGVVEAGDIRASLQFAFGAGLVRPGVARLVAVDQGAALHRLDLPALARIQRAVLLEESRGGRAPAFRSVLCAPYGLHRPIAWLYKAQWDMLDLPGVRFDVVEREAEALALLGIPADATLGPEIDLDRR